MPELQGWTIESLSAAIAALDAGVSVNAEDRPHAAGEIGILKTSALNGGVFRPEQNKAILARERRRAAEPVIRDSILLSRMNTPALVGESCYVDDDWPTLFVPDRIWQLKPWQRDSISMRWLSYVLRSTTARAHIETHATGTSGSMKNLPKRKLLDLAVNFPPLREQQLIAEVLDTLDTTIRQTEAVIEKLKQVKQGLLHDLLTRGIDANGELRPPQRQAPHLYKDSPLGWIPNKWDAVAVSDLAENLDGQRLPIKETERQPGIYPYYGASGIIDWVESHILDGDFVLLGEDGENVVSRNLPLAFRVTGKIWVNNHAHIYEPRAGVDIRFLVEVLEAKDYGPWVSGSAQPKLTQDALARIRLQRPPAHEQVEIADRLEACATRIAAERVEMLKLERLKSGLMDDLLTGRVRVTPLLNATP